MATCLHSVTMGQVPEGCRLKLARANHHFEALIRELLKVGRNYPHGRADQIDAQTGEKVWRYVGKPPDPPVELNPLIGDVLYNLRSALDHLAWQLVLVAGGTPTYRTAFPLFDDARRYRKLAPAKVSGMDGKAVAEIERLQPYHKGNARQIRLGWLEELGNIDKHRHFNLTIAAIAGGMWSHPLPGVGPAEAPIHVGPVNDGVELARVPEHADVDFIPIFDVAFGRGGPAPGESVTLTLNSLRGDVNVVLGLFARLFFA